MFQVLEPSAPGFAIDAQSSQSCHRPRATAQNLQTRAERWHNFLCLHLCVRHYKFATPGGALLILIATQTVRIARPTMAVMAQALTTGCKRNFLMERLASVHLTLRQTLRPIEPDAQLATPLPSSVLFDWATESRRRGPEAAYPLFPRLNHATAALKG
jgi:hypothetical protein